MAIKWTAPYCARHVRYRAVPRANRIPAPSTRTHQLKPPESRRADIVMQSSGLHLRSDNLMRDLSFGCFGGMSKLASPRQEKSYLFSRN